MLYAIETDGKRIQPVKDARALCPGCKKIVIAKCGVINVHHWSHLNGCECDPWHEPETEWHIGWKKQFEEKELSQKQEQEKLKQLQEQKALEDFTKSIESFVEQNKDTYKFVNAYSGSQIILNHCIEHAKRTGDVLDMKEAAQAAEDYLREEWKKGQALMQPVAEQPGEPRKTLNNSMSQTLSSAPSMLPAKNENERLKRALAALGG